MDRLMAVPHLTALGAVRQIEGGFPELKHLVRVLLRPSLEPTHSSYYTPTLRTR
jgi:hypothetical protein